MKKYTYERRNKIVTETAFTAEQINNYKEKIFIKKAIIKDKWMVWIFCKYCQDALIPFKKELETQELDQVLSNHECNK